MAEIVTLAQWKERLPSKQSGSNPESDAILKSVSFLLLELGMMMHKIAVDLFQIGAFEESCKVSDLLVEVIETGQKLSRDRK